MSWREHHKDPSLAYWKHLRPKDTIFNEHRTRKRTIDICLRGSVLGKTAGERLSLPVYGSIRSLGQSSLVGYEGIHTLPSRHSHHRLLSRVPFNLISLKRRIRRPHPATSDDHPPAHGTTIVSDPAWHIDTHDDVAMNAIQTSLAILKEGSSLAAKFPFIAPVAGLLLQALTMRDEMKQYKQECEIVMYKLARIARIIVNVCERYNLSEEELPASLRDILGSLQRTRELDRIERVLKKCSKRKDLKGILLRKDLLTKIKQRDVELSNVLQAFQVRFIFIHVRWLTYLPVG
ncbi:hypothetical protein EDB92DRAFT_2016915 [Lactarius akahatsu]|uniref:Uncharacterized protein n=1 Tax=Lactarius akahatsu TaxID=416441 RepID=A0AAD4Q6Z3_9AGAM|nr:hypothetical protein EDB92DRAFT_2016915 [Lactarius akahatsu]